MGVSVPPSVLLPECSIFGALVLSTALSRFASGPPAKDERAGKWLMHATILHIQILLGLMAYDKSHGRIFVTRQSA